VGIKISFIILFTNAYKQFPINVNQQEHLNHSQILCTVGSRENVILSSCAFSVSILLITLRNKERKEGRKTRFTDSESKMLKEIYTPKSD
jgi:hypothetical protein